ncbi:hypothetical protein V6N11_060683 [Hibiscus sabdariffa]|uniref:Uncharacterized protein n=2 Tax=Hibiscus sabdariffa TaxID=183260 RepID=A0ABR2QR38_9ROSI
MVGGFGEARVWSVMRMARVGLGVAMVVGFGGSDGLMFGKEMGCSRLKVETGVSGEGGCWCGTADGGVVMVQWVVPGDDEGWLA